MSSALGELLEALKSNPEWGLPILVKMQQIFSQKQVPKNFTLPLGKIPDTHKEKVFTLLKKAGFITKVDETCGIWSTTEQTKTNDIRSTLKNTEFVIGATKTEPHTLPTTPKQRGPKLREPESRGGPYVKLGPSDTSKAPHISILKTKSEIAREIGGNSAEAQKGIFDVIEMCKAHIHSYNTSVDTMWNILDESLGATTAELQHMRSLFDQITVQAEYIKDTEDFFMTGGAAMNMTLKKINSEIINLIMGITAGAAKTEKKKTGKSPFILVPSVARSYGKYLVQELDSPENRGVFLGELFENYKNGDLTDKELEGYDEKRLEEAIATVVSDVESLLETTAKYNVTSPEERDWTTEFVLAAIEEIRSIVALDTNPWPDIRIGADTHPNTKSENRIKWDKFRRGVSKVLRFLIGIVMLFVVLKVAFGGLSGFESKKQLDDPYVTPYETTKQLISNMDDLRETIIKYDQNHKTNLIDPIISSEGVISIKNLEQHIKHKDRSLQEYMETIEREVVPKIKKQAQIVRADEILLESLEDGSNEHTKKSREIANAIDKTNQDRKNVVKGIPRELFALYDLATAPLAFEGTLAREYENLWRQSGCEITTDHGGDVQGMWNELRSKAFQTSPGEMRRTITNVLSRATNNAFMGLQSTTEFVERLTDSFSRAVSDWGRVVIRFQSNSGEASSQLANGIDNIVVHAQQGNALGSFINPEGFRAANEVIRADLTKYNRYRQDRYTIHQINAVINEFSGSHSVVREAINNEVKTGDLDKKYNLSDDDLAVCFAHLTYGNPTEGFSVINYITSATGDNSSFITRFLRSIASYTGLFQFERSVIQFYNSVGEVINGWVGPFRSQTSWGGVGSVIQMILLGAAAYMAYPYVRLVGRLIGAFSDYPRGVVDNLLSRASIAISDARMAGRSGEFERWMGSALKLIRAPFDATVIIANGFTSLHRLVLDTPWLSPLSDLTGGGIIFTGFSTFAIISLLIAIAKNSNVFTSLGTALAGMSVFGLGAYVAKPIEILAPKAMEMLVTYVLKNSNQSSWIGSIVRHGVIKIYTAPYLITLGGLRKGYSLIPNFLGISRWSYEPVDSDTAFKPARILAIEDLIFETAATAANLVALHWLIESVIPNVVNRLNGNVAGDALTEFRNKGGFIKATTPEEAEALWSDRIFKGFDEKGITAANKFGALNETQIEKCNFFIQRTTDLTREEKFFDTVGKFSSEKVQQLFIRGKAEYSEHIEASQSMMEKVLSRFGSKATPGDVGALLGSRDEEVINLLISPQ